MQRRCTGYSCEVCTVTPYCMRFPAPCQARALTKFSSGGCCQYGTASPTSRCRGHAHTPYHFVGDGVLDVPFRPTSPRPCHFEPVLTLAWESVSLVQRGEGTPPCKRAWRLDCRGTDYCTSLYPKGMCFAALRPLAAYFSARGLSFPIPGNKKRSAFISESTSFGPSVEIRTRGLLNPIQARYQTSPHPDIQFCFTQPDKNTTSSTNLQALF